jgi:hypothetical protein
LLLRKLITSFSDFNSRTNLSNSSAEKTSFFNSYVILISVLLSEYKVETSSLWYLLPLIRFSALKITSLSSSSIFLCLQYIFFDSNQSNNKESFSYLLKNSFLIQFWSFDSSHEFFTFVTIKILFVLSTLKTLLAFSISDFKA